MAQEENQQNKKKNTLLYAILIFALVATWTYIYIDKNKTEEHQEQLRSELTDLDSSKSAVEEQFKATLTQLDFLKSENDSLMRTKSKEIADLKKRIQDILQKNQNSEAELENARSLIAQLENKASGYEKEISRLKNENVLIAQERDSIQTDLMEASTENEALSARNDTLSEKISIASILKADHIEIAPIRVKNSGKEKEIKNARRTDLLRIDFEIEGNKVAESGEKELYIVINDPKGVPIAVERKGSGKFILADGTEKLYTLTKTFNFTTGQEQHLSVDWDQEEDFEKGMYSFEIYQQGHLIGKSSKELR